LVKPGLTSPAVARAAHHDGFRWIFDLSEAVEAGPGEGRRAVAPAELVGAGAEADASVWAGTEADGRKSSLIEFGGTS
jgi:hypothetical protein